MQPRCRLPPSVHVWILWGTLGRHVRHFRHHLHFFLPDPIFNSIRSRGSIFEGSQRVVPSSLEEPYTDLIFGHFETASLYPKYLTLPPVLSPAVKNLIERTLSWSLPASTSAFFMGQRTAHTSIWPHPRQVMSSGSFLRRWCASWASKDECRKTCKESERRQREGRSHQGEGAVSTEALRWEGQWVWGTEMRSCVEPCTVGRASGRRRS